MENEETEAVTPELAANSTEGASRRDFLRSSAGTAAALLAGGIVSAGAAAPREAKAAGATKSAGGIPVPKADAQKMYSGEFPKAPIILPSRKVGANDRLNVAFIGVGGMGGSHVHNYADDWQGRNIQIVAICDVFQPRREASAKYAISKGAATDKIQLEKDYRRLLENKDIDAITIATPEHWHAQIACHAMEAGKHVYIQKPMTRYLDEAFQVHDVAVRTGRTVQIGSQGCSDMRFHAAADAIRAGKIGKLIRAEDAYTRAISYAAVDGHPASGEWNYAIPGEISPTTLDWEMWLGSAPDRAYKFEGGAAEHAQPMRDDAGSRFARYRKYKDYSAGIFGDLMPHRLHPIMLASGNPEYPTKVMATGTQITTDREVPDSVYVLAEFPSGWTITFLGSTCNERGIDRVIHGEKANLLLSGDPTIVPERPYSEEIDGATLTVNGPNFETHNNHEKNWIDCIRSGKTPNCNIDLATKTQTVISLAEMSLRQNKMMLFDEKTRTAKAG